MTSDTTYPKPIRITFAILVAIVLAAFVWSFALASGASSTRYVLRGHSCRASYVKTTVRVHGRRTVECVLRYHTVTLSDVPFGNPGVSTTLPVDPTTTLPDDQSPTLVSATANMAGTSGVVLTAQTSDTPAARAVSFVFGGGGEGTWTTEKNGQTSCEIDWALTAKLLSRSPFIVVTATTFSSADCLGVAVTVSGTYSPLPGDPIATAVYGSSEPLIIAYP